MRGIAIVLVTLAGSGCRESCLDGAANCRISSPCQGLHYQCGGGMLELRVLDGRAPLDGLETGGARGGIPIGNGRLVGALADGFYWSANALLPFSPAQGFDYVSFGLTDIENAYRTAPFVAASTHEGAPVAYAQVGCNVDGLEGFQSPTVSASGLPRTVI